MKDREDGDDDGKGKKERIRMNGCGALFLVVCSFKGGRECCEL